MICQTGDLGGEAGGNFEVEPTFSALLEDSAEDLYERAPCGYLSTLMDGTIAKINTTLLEWLGIDRDELVGRRRFSDLLTVGGRIYHETHFAPMLRMHGEVGGIALELKRADGTRLPVLVSSTVKVGANGTAQLIRTTVFDARDRRAYEQEQLRARQEAEHARQEAERERDRVQLLATTLQRTLLPPSLPNVPGMDVAAYYHPASADEVGGDFYDLFPLADGTWAFFLGDVSGKGADAAVVTSLARYTLRAAAVYDPRPVAVLEHLNRVLVHEQLSSTPRFCTAVHGLLEPVEGGATVTLASGGHPPALLIRHHGAAELLTTRGGQLIGALPHARFVERQVHLRPGDTLLLYSDGLTEARIDGRTRYDEEELRDFAGTLDAGGATELVAAITRLLDSFGDGVDDDTALLAVSVRLPGDERS